MKFPVAENILWLAGFVSSVCLFAVLLVRSHTKAFPVFTAFVFYQIAETVGLFVTHEYFDTHAYYLGYWVTAFGGYIFQVALIYEIARIVLRPAGAWAPAATQVFLKWSIIGMFVAAILTIGLTPLGKSGMALWAMRSSIFTSLLICEAFLAMSVSANRLGLRRKRHVMALGEGLTLWAVVALIGDVAHFLTGWDEGMHIFTDAQSLAYVLTLVFLIVSFNRPENKGEILSSEAESRLIALHNKMRSDLAHLTSRERR